MKTKSDMKTFKKAVDEIYARHPAKPVRSARPRQGQSESFTPGKWGVEKDDGLYIESEFGTLARVAPCGSDFDAEDEGNAKLMASAPELLQALKLILEAARHRYATTGKIEIEGLAETAIEMAEGRAL